MIMRYLRIVSKNVIKSFWCKGCKRSHNELIKVGQSSFCDLCIPEKYKDNLVNVNQNRELI